LPAAVAREIFGLEPSREPRLSIRRELVRQHANAEDAAGAMRPAAGSNSNPEGANMRVMVIVKANEDSEAGVLPDQQILEQMGKYNEELVNAGVMVAGEGLHASFKGKRVRFSGDSRTVIDGPFTETKELIAGYWLWQVESMDEAVAWLKRAPFDGGTEIELRPVFETEDFAASDPTGEIRDAEHRLRAEVAARQQTA
jgi:hypothetical protein